MNIKSVNNLTRLLAHAMESINEIASITDLEDNFIFVNKAFLFKYGYTYNEVIGKNCGILWSPNNPPDLSKMILHESRINGWKGEVLNVTKDGLEFPISLQTSTVKDEDNNIIGLVGIAEDITEKKIAESELKKSQEKYRELIENIQEGILEVDNDDVIKFVNKRFCEIVGFSREELIGKVGYKTILPENRHEVIRNKNIDRRLGKSEQYEIELQKKSGEIIHAVMFASPIKDNNGNVTGSASICLDITDQKKIEEERKKSEELFRSIWEESSDGMRLTDKKGKILLVNDVFCQYVGKNRYELENSLIADMYAPSEGERVMNAYLNNYNNNSLIAHHENKLDLWDGRQIWFSCANSFINVGGEKLVLSIFRDITTQRTREEKLKKSEAQLKKLLSELPDIVLVHINGHLVYVNQATVTAIGRTEEELLGQDVLNFVVDEYKPLVIKNMESRMKGEIVPDYEVDVLTFERGVRNVIVRTSEITFDEQSSVIVILIDITERKKAETELRESEEKFRNLAESCPFGIMIYQGENWIYTNPAGVKISGYSIDELYKMKFWEFVSPDYLELVKERGMKRQNAEDVESQYDFKIVTKEGIPKWITLTGSLIQYNGKPAGLISVVDITDRKEFEEKIQKQNEELKQINAEKDKFFSIISHDLRSPFQGFLGFTQLIAEGIEDMSLKQVQVMAVRLRDSAMNLYELIENLLNWSLIKRGGERFEPLELNLREMCESTVNLLKQNTDKKNITINIEVPEDATVVADKQMLKTVLRNLLSNAVKFSHRGKSIIIESATNNFDEVEISITDFGIGMSEDIINMLFKIDGKVSAPGTEGEPSTGLGLVLCKEFVEKHGGKINVQSSPGLGSKFSFTLKKNLD